MGIDGTLENCQNITPSVGLNNPTGVAINNGYLYIMNSAFTQPSTIGSSYTQCSASDATNPCTLTTPTGNGALNNPIGITIQNNYAYIANYSNQTYTLCKVNILNNNLTDCSTNAINGMPLTGTPEVVIINNGYAYITDQVDDGYMQCKVNAADGTLSVCQFKPLAGSGDTVAPVGPRGGMINGNYAYFVNSGYHGGNPVPDAVSSYTKCTTNPNGDLSNCMTSLTAPGVLNSPTGIALNGSYVYITNEQGPGYSYTMCSIDAANGSLISCNTSQTGGSSSTPQPSYTYITFGGN